MALKLRSVDSLVCSAHSSGGARAMSSGSHRPPQVAVIGGGVAGAVCSHLLARRGAHVEVFDMGRQLPGGRVSSRIVTMDRGGGSAGGGGGGGGGGARGAGVFQFDYGCQFFQATSPAMKRLVAEWLAAGVVAEWRPRLGVYDVARAAVRARAELTEAEAAEVAASGLPPLPTPSSGPLYVGSPSMAALVAHLLGPGAGAGLVAAPGDEPAAAAAAGAGGGGGGGGGITLRLDTRVHAARWSGGHWHLAWQQRGQPQPQPQLAFPDGGGGGGVGGGYDALVLTDSQVARPGAPGHVSFEGAPPSLLQLADRMRGLTRVPQFALMVGWEGGAPGAADDGLGQASNSRGGDGGGSGGGSGWSPVSSASAPELPVDALHVSGGKAVQWIAVDSSKPGRSRADGGGQCWVALTRPDFAAQLLAADQRAAEQQQQGAGAGAGGSPPPPAPAGPEYRAAKAEQIWGALQRDLAGMPGLAPLPPPSFLTAHRWSSCYTTSPLGPGLGLGKVEGQPAVWEAEGRWAAAGDFCTGGPGFERAAASGAAAAAAVAEMLGMGLDTGSAADAAAADSDWKGAC